MREGLLVDEPSDVVSSAKKKKSGEEADKVLVLVADKDTSKPLSLVVSVPPQPIVVNRPRSQSAPAESHPPTRATPQELTRAAPEVPLLWRSFFPTAISTLGHSPETRLTDRESTSGLTGACTRVSGAGEKHRERESSRGLLVLPLRENSSRVGWKASAHSSDPTGIPTVARGAPIVNTDGSCCVGTWNINKDIMTQELNGTFYTGNGKEHCLKGSENDLALPATATRKRSSVDGARGSNMNFPRICIWESDGEAGDITCDIIDTVEASMIYREGLDRDGIRQFRRGPCCFNGEVKKPGETISKGHKNYDLMLNLQLGIRYSVGKHAQIRRDLKPSDFDPKEKFWTRFPPEGSKITPPHQSVEFRWKDYCPMVFRHLREHFQVDTADYMLAICGNDALRELSSPGKSGSFFYLTQDDRFMIKTVKKSEVKVLIRMLPSYYQHVCRYENSLVTKFFGVHCVKPIGAQKTRFIVMGNLFCSEYRIHRRFDLKGSSHGRTTDKPEGEIDETTTLKDLDLNFVFRLQRNWYQELIKQINRDCEFLEAERIMDYSLLVGLHFRDDNNYDKMGLSPFVLRSGNKDSYQNEKFMRGCRFLEAELQDRDRILAGRKPLIRLGANMPARAERMARRSDFDQYTPGGISHLTPSRSGEIYEVVLYFGIIDILQDYDISKKLEHAYKSLQADPTSISAVDPKLYSKRFRDFIGRIFIEDR
ncbi:hypothetical protein GH714_024218 [Hevea brasiliensis]|uniref:1-phosphatidylinositol-4-phosphate 5-kinase n=1 Tax=Hevea brasiliensis TaxID=3981 RepID=A0A6A6KTS2_HEVBR|nr:hypothetical protein GH714_024218 [Hevea brasiliensis]